MRVSITVLRLYVSQSVILSHNKKWISKMAASSRLKQALKCCTGHFEVPFMCQNIWFQLIFSEKAAILWRAIVSDCW